MTRNNLKGNSLIGRREFLKMSVAAGGALAVGLPQVSRAAGQFAGQSLVFVSWGGAFQDAQKAGYCDPFAEKTGATVVQSGPGDYAKLRLMVESKDVTWDVVDVEDSFVYANKDILEPIDKKIVDTSRIDPRFVTDHGVGCLVWSWNIGYSKAAYGDSGPQNWADLYDTKKFPGRRSLTGDVNGNLEIALLADGVDPKDLYPLDVDRAFKKLDTIKSDVVFWATNSQSQQLLTDGEVNLGVINNGRIWDANKKGANLGIQWNQNLISAEALVVPKGTKKLELAMALVNEMTLPENQARFANRMAMAPTNPDAFKFVDSSVASWLPTAPENVSKGVAISAEYWRDNLKTLTNRWEAWKVG